MNKYHSIIFILICVGCTLPKEANEAVFIFDDEKVMESYRNENDTLDCIGYYIRIPQTRYTPDSVVLGIAYNFYFLESYLKNGRLKDTAFAQSESFLDSIRYVDSEWLKNKDNLEKFWSPVDCWRCGGFYDTAKIFLITRIENTDSVMVRQVHRLFQATTD